MGKDYQSKNNYLEDLAKSFEESLKTDSKPFFHEDELEKLIDYYESKPNYPNALQVIDRAIELFPYSGSFYIKLAQINFYLKQYNDCWYAIEQAEIYDSQSTEVMLLKADLFTVDQNYDAAIDVLKALYAIIDSNERADILLEIADVYEIAERPEQLERILKHILEKYPSSEEAIHRYWNHCIDYDHFDTGASFFEELTQKSPYNFLAWYYLGKTLFELGLTEKACDAFAFCMAINNYYFAYWDFGECLISLERWEEAINHFQYMIEEFSPDFNISIQIGHCYQQLNRPTKAISHFHEAKNQTSENNKKALAHFFISKVLIGMDNNRQAIDHLRQCVRLNPKKTKYWNKLAKLQFELGQYCESSNNIIQSLAKNDKQIKQWLLLAKCYFELGTKELAIDSLTKAKCINSDNADIQISLASYLIENGQKQSGLQELQSALELDSSKKQIIFALFPKLANDQEVSYLLEQY